jgi:lipopolysaccharide/colanic/teichoic acid biosynthesis glycosyltransferase
MLTSAWAAFIAELLVRLFGDYSLAPLQNISLIGGMVGVISFLTYYLFSIIIFKLGLKKHVSLDVGTTSEDELKLILERKKLLHQINIVPVSTLRQLVLTRKAYLIDAVVTSTIESIGFENEGLLLRAHLAGVKIHDVDQLINSLWGRIPLRDINHLHFLSNARQQNLFLRLYWQFKNIAEPIIACVLLILLAPMMALIAILIKIDSRGSALYVQNRTGYLGQQLKLIKFRSMISDAEIYGPQWSQKDDNRITRVGRILRRTRLDELPQLWNVIRGDMGFIGPRPERPEFYKQVKDIIPLFYLRTLVKPGITGWAQVWSGYAATVEESRIKLEFDLYYIQNMSPSMDLNVLIRTTSVAIRGEERSDVSQQLLFADKVTQTNKK